MADLSIEFCGVKFKNPIVIGSAHPSRNAEYMRRCCEAGAGGIAAKTVETGPNNAAWREGRSRPVFALLHKQAYPYNYTNYSSAGAADYSVADWLKELEKAKKYCEQSGTVLMGSPGAGHHNLDDSVQTAKDMENLGVDLIELNVGSPVGVVQPVTDAKQDPTNAFKKKAFASQLERTQELIGKIRAAVRIPLVTKVTFYGIDLPSVCVALKGAGTQALTIANRMKGLEIDLKTGRPLLGGGFCGISGPWTRPLVMGGVAIVAKETGLPIMSGSGAYFWEDAVKLMMCGASLVQVVTPITHGRRGYKTVGDWLKKMDGFLEQKGVKSVKEIVGKTLPQIRAWDTLVRIPRGEIWAEIVPEKCNHCLLCLTWCFYDALFAEGKKPMIKKERCEGCANCITLCPKGAIVMKGDHPVFFGDGL